MAKAPVAGRSKTRLCPPCTPQEAAALAEAALADTLATVASTPDVRPIAVLDGAQGAWLPKGVEVIGQRGDGLARRIAAAFEDAGGPAFLIGMDTPQVSVAMLEAALARLDRPGVDAVLGEAEDGGWWGVGVRVPDRRLFEGVPMSTPRTGAEQRQRLADRGLSCAPLPTLRDVDRFADAVAVAGMIPGSRFARTLARIGSRLEAAVPA